MGSNCGLVCLGLQDRALTVSMWVTWLSPGRSCLSPSMCQISRGTTRSRWCRARRHIIEPEPSRTLFTKCDHHLSCRGPDLMDQNQPRSEPGVWLCSLERNQPPGFPSFPLLRGGMGLFRAQMDVPALPVRHPKGRCHVMLHIKS